VDQGYSLVGTFSAPGGAAFAHLIVYGYGGDDGLVVSSGVVVPGLLFGGEGNDTIQADGTADAVLIGGAGNDSLYGGGGRNVMIGGLGADFLNGGGGDDILIGGYTDYDSSVPALLAILKEWGRTDANYSTRMKHLQGSLGGGLNGSSVLIAKTVHDDGVIDNLYGGTGTDWFFVGGKGKKADTTDKAGGEVVTSI